VTALAVRFSGNATGTEIEPEEQSKVCGSPATPTEELRAQLVASVTVAVTVVDPPVKLSAAGLAERPEILGAGVVAEDDGARIMGGPATRAITAKPSTHRRPPMTIIPPIALLKGRVIPPQQGVSS
jgi:hypothetical protein